MKSFLLLLSALAGVFLLQSFAQDAPEPVEAAPAPALEYHLVTARTSSNLDHAVNLKIKDGWRPHGGVGLGAYASDGGQTGQNKGTYYAQAMVRERGTK